MTHQGSIVVNWRWYKYVFHSRFRYATGRPYTPVTDRTYAGAAWAPVYGDVNSFRLPHYRRLDLRVEREWLWPKAEMRLYLELLNVEGRRNIWNVVYSADYAERYEAGQVPRIPALGLDVSF